MDEIPEIVSTTKIIEFSQSTNNINEEKDLENLKQLNEQKRLEKFEKFMRLSKEKTLNNKAFTKKRFSLPPNNSVNQNSKLSDNDLYIRIMQAYGIKVTNKDVEKWDFPKRMRWETEMKSLKVNLEKLGKFMEEEDGEENSLESPEKTQSMTIHSTEKKVELTQSLSPQLQRPKDSIKIDDKKKQTRSLGVVKLSKKTYFDQSLIEIFEAEKNYPGYEQAMTQLQMRVPLIMIRLIKLIEINNGIEEEGIFRLSPSILVIEKFKAKIFKKAEKKSVKKFNNLKCDDHNLAASILKQWFIGLIEPLFPNYNACVNALDNVDKVLSVARSLPSIHGRTFFYLLKFLRSVAESDKNKMTLNSLALVWSPALLKCPHLEVDYQLAAKHTVMEGKFISTLFEKHPNHLIGFGSIGSDVKILPKKISANIINFRVTDDYYLLEYEEDKIKKTAWLPEKEIQWQVSNTTVEREVYLSKFLEDN
eukprot:TRINITY_DN765_c3_g1_i1.p1 TRINITY_DN765_c3_g1~~TRINITY_DN765_c3_g1_i1.p1  ORF type:complete len:476 (-),score=129.82 TRINITY_DN765_c3_g1_i1:117-1544(-)